MANATTPVIQINEGNVGIGTTTPLAKLDIQGTQGQLFSVTDDLSGSIFAVADISGVPIFDVNSSGVSYFDGNVGVGTTSPDTLLHVSKNSSNSQLTIERTGTAPGKYGFYTNTGNLFINNVTGGASTIPMIILNNGNVGIGAGNPSSKLAIDGGFDYPTVRWFSSNNTSRYMQVGMITPTEHSIRAYGSSSELTFWTASSFSMVIDGGGNVGIGVTTTNYKLEVDGASKISGPVIIGSETSSYGDFAIKDAYNASVNSSKTSFIWAQNGGRAALYLTAGSTGASQVGFGPSQYASQNTAGSIEYTVSSNQFTFKTNYTLALTIANNQTATFANTVTATNFILSSDKTLKNNIKEIDTNHVDVNWKNFELKSEPGVKRSGVIAQELEEKHPEFVRTDDEGMKSVAYIDLLIAKIAELEARLEKAGI